VARNASDELAERYYIQVRGGGNTAGELRRCRGRITRDRNREKRALLKLRGRPAEESSWELKRFGSKPSCT
jgi:hypothetical protein